MIVTIGGCTEVQLQLKSGYFPTPLKIRLDWSRIQLDFSKELDNITLLCTLPV